MALAPKQKLFVNEYLVDLNATAAAVRAGYSKKTASQKGYALLQKPEIAAAIQEAQKARMAKIGVTSEMVLSELADVAFQKAYDWTDANLKVSNKLRALELLGKHLGLFEGQSAGAKNEGGNPLDAILNSTKEDVDLSGIPELQQAPAPGDDLVEPAEPEST